MKWPINTLKYSQLFHHLVKESGVMETVLYHNCGGIHGWTLLSKGNKLGTKKGDLTMNYISIFKTH